jgi:hypothetical protein
VAFPEMVGVCKGSELMIMLVVERQPVVAVPETVSVNEAPPAVLVGETNPPAHV